jgi:hypothetical protein
MLEEEYTGYKQKIISKIMNDCAKVWNIKKIFGIGEELWKGIWIGSVEYGKS